MDRREVVDDVGENLRPLGAARAHPDLLVPGDDLDAVARVGAAVPGSGAPGVRFGTMIPRSAQLARYWTNLVDHVEQAMLANDELMASPLVRGEALRQLAAGVLFVFPNSTLDRPAASARPAKSSWSSGAPKMASAASP